MYLQSVCSLALALPSASATLATLAAGLHVLPSTIASFPSTRAPNLENALSLVLAHTHASAMLVTVVMVRLLALSSTLVWVISNPDVTGMHDAK
jgi:hypothetical protein